MRRHPVPERLQIAVVGLRLAAERGDVILAAVESLPAGDDLHVPEEQVERVRILRPAGLEVCVEGRFAIGKPVTNNHSPLLSHGICGGTWGQLDLEQLDGSLRALADCVDHAGERLAHDGHDVEVVADEAELGVERDVLGQVARGVVPLGAEGTPGLVDASKTPTIVCL